MKNDHGFSWKSRLLSFKYAFNGWGLFFKHQPNAWIHLVFGVLAIIGGIVFQITRFEWMALTFAVGLVFLAEIVNSAIERLSDVYTQQFDQGIKETKDLAAGAVLWSALVAISIGLFIFLPRLWTLFTI